MTYYKATRPDGTDFRTGSVDYAAALLSGQPVIHATSTQIVPNEPETYLSVSVEPAETLLGGAWPARLFRVEPIGDVVGDLRASKHKRAVLGLRVVEELPSWMVLGPNGVDVAAILERAKRLTEGEVRRMFAAWNAARDVAYYAAWDAALDAAWDAARGAAHRAAHRAAYNDVWDEAWDAARGAAFATLTRDLITPEQYSVLMAPWLADVEHE